MSVPFTDTHVHFWDLREKGLRYPWLDRDWLHPVIGDHAAIKSLRYRPEDFRHETRFTPPARVIHVQATAGDGDPVAETRWVSEALAASGLDFGIVARVRLDEPDLSSTVAAHRSFGALCGLRDQRYDNYLSNERWLAGLDVLDRTGLVLLDDPDLDLAAKVVAVVEARPGLTYCVDHAGWPKQRDRSAFLAWRDAMRLLAGLPNSIVKISGLGMSDHEWTVDSIRPWVLTCIELWGTDRACFGTNWPVDRLFSSYADVVGAYREIIADLSHDEQTALLSGTADRVFVAAQS